MLTPSLMAVATTPLEWSPTVAIIMIICNVIAIAFAKAKVQYPSAEPALPSAPMFGGMGLPGLLATTSFGHILGAGVILGLHSIGKI